MSEQPSSALVSAAYLSIGVCAAFLSIGVCSLPQHWCLQPSSAEELPETAAKSLEELHTSQPLLISPHFCSCDCLTGSHAFIAIFKRVYSIYMDYFLILRQIFTLTPYMVLMAFNQLIAAITSIFIT